MRVAVFMGSSPGLPSHQSVATTLGRAIAEAGHGIVYGGAHVGLMGLIADTALAAGAEVVGVIPKVLVDWEVAHSGLTELHVVEDMHERKAKMADLADAFVALPGGIGTLEELIEIYTWSYLGIHDKPFAVLNTAGYYDGFTAFLDHAVGQGFLRPEVRERLLVAPDPEALLAAWG